MSFWDYLWGDTWQPGMDSLGRYLVIFVALVFVAIGVMIWLSVRSDRSFARSCYARGGHVHYRHRSGPPIYIDAGSVNVPVPTTITTMHFAPGPEADCRECN